MQKKVAKLIVAAAVLAGSLGIGLAPQTASAAITCPPLCCDPACHGIRVCRWVSGSGCICSQFCQFNPPGGGD
ncbi:MAG TPA: hypothetical protein VF173_39050 [Thermoanaerobaculia bacterium]|nr:hypothetical protein [Thermoanaerobaculia bacterium]